jgi:predicted negative regulator of RcsB-dependent stress response
MPKAIKKRVPKKTDTPEEGIQETFSNLKATFRERQSTVLKIGIGILIIIIAIVSFLAYSYTKETSAKKLEYEAYKIYYSRGPMQPANNEEQYKKALNVFKKAYDTRKSPFSLYYIAACSYELGQYDEALKTLKDFSQRYSGEEKYLPLVYRKMITIYIKKGNADEAKKTLDALYNLKGDIYKDFALMEYGRILEKEGKADEARKKYEELITRFPNSPFKDEAQIKLSGKKEG